jgi:hypothetical protein
MVAMVIALAVSMSHAWSSSEGQPAADRSLVVLFDGTTTDEWRGYNRKEMPEGWVIEDGCLHRKGAGGDIVTREQFDDFELNLEWKVAPGGNSGIMYRVSEGDLSPYISGPEYQVLDNAGHRDGGGELTSAGALYGMYATNVEAVKPAGEWNRARIVVSGNHIEHWLNGVKVVDCEMWSDDWNARLAQSKFANWGKYARNRRGHIALQDHGDPVWYRDISIRILRAPAGEGNQASESQ